MITKLALENCREQIQDNLIAMFDGLLSPVAMDGVCQMVVDEFAKLEVRECLPMCWKCKNCILDCNIHMIGCKENPEIKSYEDAKKLCLLLKQL